MALRYLFPMPTLLARTLLPAVLLLLAGCDGSPPTQPEGSDPDRLLTDAELRTPEDPAAQPIDPAWSDWIQQNHHPIRSLTSEDFSDLQFLKPLLQGKRLVQLGEGWHGMRENSQVKVRLIKFLHEEMGFDVVAWESPIYGCFTANDRIGQDTPDAPLRQCAYQVWWTHEVRELFEYLAETRNTGRPLILAGFDIQEGMGREHLAGRPAFLREIVARADPAYADEVFAMDTRFVSNLGSYSALRELVEVEGDSFMDAYNELAAFLHENHEAVAGAGGEHAAEALIAEQVARSMPVLIRCTLAEDVWEQWLYRDPAMADNVSFLLEELYPDERIVLWAANGHIFHRNTDIPVYGERNARSMGTWLVERHRPVLYTIGLYQYTGQAYDLSRQIYDILPAPPNSIEAVLYRARRKFLFTDLSLETRNTGNAWMFEPLGTLLGGLSLVQMVPRDQQDAILFIHTITPAGYY